MVPEVVSLAFLDVVSTGKVALFVLLSVPAAAIPVGRAPGAGCGEAAKPYAPGVETNPGSEASTGTASCRILHTSSSKGKAEG